MTKSILCNKITHKHFATLTPFLYATPTIQRRSLSTSPRRSHIPFEHTKTKSSQPIELKRGEKPSTLTRAEREAFTQLLDLKRKVQQQDPTSTTTAATGDSSTTSNNADINASTSSIPLEEVPFTEFPHTGITPVVNPSEKLPSKDLPSPLRRAIDHDLAHVAQLVDFAKTDVEIWTALQTAVLNRVRALNLDQEDKPKKRRRQGTKAQGKGKGEQRQDDEQQPQRQDHEDGIEEPPKDLQILPHTLPKHINYIQLHLANHCRGSSLPACVMESLRRIGPRSFSMGASRQVFNTQLWILAGGAGHRERGAGVGEQMAHLLREMMNGNRDMRIGTTGQTTDGVGFDSGTAAVVRSWVSEVRAARRGERGEAARAITGMERTRRALAAMEEWVRVVAERREEDAMREVREKEREVEEVGEVS